MAHAGRATILPDDGQPIAPEVEALASHYLNLAQGNPSLALRFAAADRVSDLERLQARVACLGALVSRGYARAGGNRVAERRSSLEKPISDALLTKLGDARRALLDAQRQLRRGCVQAKGMDALVGDIDDLARLMTGDCTYFHAKAPAGNTAFRGGED
jgi:hypothetical protein